MSNSLDADGIRRWLFGDRIPVTKLVILSNVATFVATTLVQPVAFMAYTIFSAASFRLVPWTAFTYPLIGTCGVLCLVFQGYWLWVAGGSLERSWGSRVFAIFFFLVSAISAMGLLVGSMLSGANVGVAGLWMPLAGVTVAFAALNPEEQILFFFVIPMKLKYLALIGAGALFVNYGRLHWLLGLFSLAGCAFAYWYVRNGMQYGLSGRRDRQARVVRVHPRHNLLSRLNPFGWIRSRRDHRRLRELFKRSYPDDDHPGKDTTR